MDLIDKVLTTSSDSSKYSLSIRASLAISKHTLSKYYNKAGESDVYWIAMSIPLPFLSLIYIFLIAIHLVLHPCHKLEYFKRNGWDEVLIETARDIVQDEFDRSYCSMDIEGDRSTANTTQTLSNIAVGCYFTNPYFFSNNYMYRLPLHPHPKTCSIVSWMSHPCPHWETNFNVTFPWIPKM